MCYPVPVSMVTTFILTVPVYPMQVDAMVDLRSVMDDWSFEAFPWSER